MVVGSLSVVVVGSWVRVKGPPPKSNPKIRYCFVVFLFLSFVSTRAMLFLLRSNIFFLSLPLTIYLPRYPHDTFQHPTSSLSLSTWFVLYMFYVCTLFFISGCTLYLHVSFIHHYRRSLAFDVGLTFCMTFMCSNSYRT